MRDSTHVGVEFLVALNATDLSRAQLRAMAAEVPYVVVAHALADKQITPEQAVRLLELRHEHEVPWVLRWMRELLR